LRTNTSRKRKTITISTAVLLVVTLTPFVMFRAIAPPISIMSITPETGHVGDTIRIVGEIDTPNGSYTIFFDEEEVQSGTAADKTVNATFSIPNRPKGNCVVRLHDRTTDYSDTTIFTLETTYYIEAAVPSPPRQLQEGQSTEIRVSVTGGMANTRYVADVTTTDPTNTVFSNSSIQLTNTTNTGHGWANVMYPRDFGTNAHTDLTGIYKMAFNNTLATGEFTVGLTNATQYHRFQIVHIQATKYTQPNEGVWINITSDTGTVFSQNVLPIDGIVDASWKISAITSYKTYRVTITNSTPIHTIKPVPDTQNFTVAKVEFLCQIHTRNLDNESVRGIDVEAYLNVGEHVTIATGVIRISDENGLAKFLLDAGNYSFKASLNNVEVGNVPVFSLSENTTKAMTCQLVHIRTYIRDVDETPLPFVNVVFMYNRTTVENQTIPTETSVVTNSTGIAVLPNTFTNIGYTIETRRYNHLFNTTIIGNLTASLWVNLTCPAYPLFIHVLDSNEHPLQNAQVTIYEWSSERIMQSKATNEIGNWVSELTFGRYKIAVSIYNSDFKQLIVLNETVLDLIEDQFHVIYCRFFGIALSVKAVDHLGQPVSNAIIEIERKSGQEWVKIEPPPETDSDGKVTLPSIGGDYRLSVYVAGSLSEARTLNLATSGQTAFKLDKYVFVSGYLFETSQLITYVSIILLGTAFFSGLVYRKYLQRSVHRKVAPEETND